MIEEPKELTNEQKTFIRENFKNGFDLKKIVAEVWGEGTDVRTVKGRLVRAFLVAEGFQYKTARTPDNKFVELTDGQKEIIKELHSRGKKSGEIAQEVFKKKVKPLSIEHHTVMAFLKESVRPQKPVEDIVIDGNQKMLYKAPQSTGPVISKINNCTDAKIDDATISRMQLTCVEKLLANLNNSRFLAIMNTYNNATERTLYEQEFIRMTWRKPDLTPEEVNQYLNLCRDIVSLETINKHMQKLNEMFEDTQDQTEMTMKLADMIKNKSSELNETSKRIEVTIKKLQGDREKRIETQQGQSSNFLNIVKAFQEESERKRMLKMAELQRQLVSEEADRLESMDDFKARILGMEKDGLV